MQDLKLPIGKKDPPEHYSSRHGEHRKEEWHSSLKEVIPDNASFCFIEIFVVGIVIEIFWDSEGLCIAIKKYF
jgi:hypothetical protein